MTTPGLRDIRPSAFELKFIVDREKGRRIREYARTLLSPDPHGSGPGSDQYRTTTLYFDTTEFAVYKRRGSYRRAKYRIRRYDQGELVFLERKLRTPNVLSKRRTSMLLGDLSSLASDSVQAAWPGLWFRERLMMRRLSPVCQVSYSRTARVGMTDYGPIRVTLDEDVSGMAIDTLVFRNGDQCARLTDKTIVELKFTATMPAMFKQLVEAFVLEPARVSKYRLGIEATRGFSPAGVLRDSADPETLLNSLNRLDGIQKVELAPQAPGWGMNTR